MDERALAGVNAVVKTWRGVKGKDQKSSIPSPHTFFSPKCELEIRSVPQ